MCLRIFLAKKPFEVGADDGTGGLRVDFHFGGFIVLVDSGDQAMGDEKLGGITGQDGDACIAG